MLSLDNPNAFRELDPENMIEQIDDLPDQLQKAWELGNRLPLAEYQPIRQVLIAGMGGSAIGADLLAAYVEPLASVPLMVQRDYSLPAWATGPQTLVIASSHSGNTEETLSVFEQAQRAGCQLLVVSTGGKLGELAKTQQIPLWTFEHQGQPRAAVGYSFGLLLALLWRLKLIPDPSPDVEEALEAMRAQQPSLRADAPLSKNPAKRLAGQIVGRWVTVMGAGVLAPVARRWKGQISEVAKAWAQFEFLPEADHNTLAGVEQPEELISRTTVIFLRAASDHARNSLRSDLTQQGFMLAGMGTDFYRARGKGRLAHLWTALHFGDYTAYYLAMAYGVDPTAIPSIEDLKRAMQASPSS